jgi:hypothetical protein
VTGVFFVLSALRRSEGIFEGCGGDAGAGGLILHPPAIRLGCLRNIMMKIEEKRASTGRRPVHTDEQIVKALECCGGIVSHAAKTLGRSSNCALKKRIDRSEHLTGKLKEIREVNIDFVESKLMELINKGQPSAIIFFLKCQGKERGYVERLENTGKDGRDFALLPAIAPPRAISMEEWLEQNKKEATAA